MLASLSTLGLVPSESLLRHEALDPARLARIRDGLAEEGVQRNPIIVSAIEGACLVLDGAHRAEALKSLGCRLVLAQSIEPPDRVGSWGHLLPAGGLKEALRGVEEIEVWEDDPDVSGAVAEVVMPGGVRLSMTVAGHTCQEGLAGEVRALWALRGVYPEGVSHRVDPEKPRKPAENEALVVYRSFSPAELAAVVHAGEVLPPGVTRFVVPERILGVRYPLESLRSSDAGGRNAELKERVARLRAQNRIRYYAEPVILFE